MLQRDIFLTTLGGPTAAHSLSEIKALKPIDFLKNKTKFVASTMDTDCPLWPYLAYYIYNVERLLRPLDGLPCDEKKVIVNGFLENLTQRIMSASSNVLITEREILAATLGEDKIDSAEYYKILRCDDDYLENILVAYPELDRLVSAITNNFITYTLEFSINLSADRGEFGTIALLQSNDKVVGCTVSEGETHKKSRTVVIVTFDSGAKVVYKPRNLSLESSASDLLRELCVKASSPYAEWIIPKYLVKDDHGWAQHTGQMHATEVPEVSLYFTRMGFLIGFCTTITASDITSDNLIAHGSHPVPIDLETIFYSVLTQSDIPKEVRWNASQTSMLPNWTWKGTDGIGVDLSAIGGLTEQYVSINLYQHIADDQNDRFGMDGVKIYPNANVLYLDGEPSFPWMYEEQIAEGFKTFFNIATKNACHVLDAIDGMKGKRSRYVPRPTATYHYATQCSLHASLMASTAQRKTFLRKILSNDTPPAIGFIESEVAACMDLDVPYAQSKTGELNFIEPAYGGSGFLDCAKFQNGVTHAIEYLTLISENRIKFELNLIKNTLSAMRSMYEHQNKLTDHAFRAADEPDSAGAIQPSVIRHAIYRAQQANLEFVNVKLKDEISTGGLWLGFHASPGGYMEYSELGDDFYYGLSGILYGCAVASKYVDIPRQTLIALADLCYARVYLKLTNPGVHLGGFHFGVSSTIIPLYMALRYLEDKRSEEILGSFKLYLSQCVNDAWWQKYFWGADLLSGSCGCLAVLTKLYELTGDRDYCDLAGALFTNITSELVVLDGRMQVQFDKSVTRRDDSLLSGLSHGVMGCAYSIFYYNLTIANDSRVEKIFEGLLQWEIDEFDAGISNWKDYRRRSEASQGEFAWSHGLPGNYLVLDYLSRQGVEAAKDFTAAHPIDQLISFQELMKRKRPLNDSLCHGSYGLLNIFKQLSPDALSDQRLYSWVNILNFSEQDTRELRIRTADPLGLWVGKVGAILGAVGLLDEKYEFPFLPHQMDYL